MDMKTMLADIEEAKEQKAQAEGKLAQLMQQLKDEFGVTTQKAARALLDKESAALEKSDEVIKVKKEELEEAYEASEL